MNKIERDLLLAMILLKKTPLISKPMEKSFSVAFHVIRILLEFHWQNENIVYYIYIYINTFQSKFHGKLSSFIAISLYNFFFGFLYLNGINSVSLLMNFKTFFSQMHFHWQLFRVNLCPTRTLAWKSWFHFLQRIKFSIW